MSGEVRETSSCTAAGASGSSGAASSYPESASAAAVWRDS